MKKKETLQWHPAFFATLQIELEEEREFLTFENEHQLGTKPKEIDVLIIKKDKNRKIHKNIGQIFREHNIVEYKSPTDYLSIDDFYQVYGYACFYKADVPRVDCISIDEITITFVAFKMPRKLVSHLKRVKGYQMQKQSDGLYYLLGDRIPIQFVITSELSNDENLYLNSLTDKLSNEQSKKILHSYIQNKDNKLYDSMMDLIIRANQNESGGGNMCNAFDELMKKMLDEREERGEILRLINLITKKCQKGKDLNTIADDLEEEPSNIENLYNLIISEPDKSPLELADMFMSCSNSLG